jgi:DNA-binding transcriptional ArsR family regulator
LPGHYLSWFTIGMQTLLDAVSTPRRREILRLVWDDERSSGDIASHFDATWPSISRSLKTLRDAGAVKERRVGNQRLYRADRKALRPLESFLRKFWGESFDRLAEAVAEGRKKKRK